MEETLGVGRRGFVSLQDQIAELLFLAGDCPVLLFAGEPPGDVEIGLALVAAEVEHLEGAEGLAAGLQLALHLDEPLARGVDAELAEVGGDPLAPELFRHRRRRAAAAEEIGHEVAGIGGCFQYPPQKRLRLLRGIIKAFFGNRIDYEDVRPKIRNWLPLVFVQIDLPLNPPVLLLRKAKFPVFVPLLHNFL